MKITYQHDPSTGVGQRRFEWPVVPPDHRKLVCLPYAGGSSTVFRPLAQALGPAWQVVAVDPPGHGLGAPGSPLSSVPALCDVIDGQLSPALYDGGYLLGYSVGGYVAHALVQRWERDGRPRPRGLVLCAVNPPTRRDAHPVYSEQDDDALLETLEGLGGLPASLKADRGIFDMFKHVVRAGFRAYETAPPPSGPVRTPVLAVGGRRDPLARPEHLSDWRPFCARLRVELIDGAHVFLTDQRAALAGCLEDFASELEADA